MYRLTRLEYQKHYQKYDEDSPWLKALGVSCIVCAGETFIYVLQSFGMVNYVRFMNSL